MNVYHRHVNMAENVLINLTIIRAIVQIYFSMDQIVKHVSKIQKKETEWINVFVL